MMGEMKIDEENRVSEVALTHSTVIARHEVGHACMAAQLGYKVHHCDFCTKRRGGPFGEATYTKPQPGRSAWPG